MNNRFRNQPIGSMENLAPALGYPSTNWPDKFHHRKQNRFVKFTGFNRYFIRGIRGHFPWLHVPIRFIAYS